MFSERLDRLENATLRASNVSAAVRPAVRPESESNEQVTSHPDQEEVSTEVQYALDQMIYQFLGVLFVAIIIGTAIGAICIMCVMKCCSGGQKKRLEEANRRGMHFRADSTMNNTTTRNDMLQVPSALSMTDGSPNTPAEQALAKK